MKKIYFEDIEEGEVIWGDQVIADPEEMLAYNKRNDPWPIHIDETAAKASPFGGLIASGGYTITLMYRSSIGVYNTPELQWQFLGGFDWKLKFPLPVRPHDQLQVRYTIGKKTPSRKSGRGIAEVYVEMFNQDREVVLSIEIVFLMATRPQTS